MSYGQNPEAPHSVTYISTGFFGFSSGGIIPSVLSAGGSSHALPGVMRIGRAILGVLRLGKATTGTLR
jgi:hypothetical protein